MKTKTSVIKLCFNSGRRFSVYLWLLFLCIFSGGLYAQSRIVWNDQNINRLTIQFEEGKLIPDTYRLVSLDVQAFKSAVGIVPLESNQKVSTSTSVLAFPMPDGSFKDFRIVESPVMEQGLATKFPEFKTYSGQSVNEPYATIRFGMTSLGFHAIIFTQEGTILIDAVSLEAGAPYMVFYMKDLKIPKDYKGCEYKSSESIKDYINQGPNLRPTGDQLRTFRLAMAATGEYAAQYGGSVANSQAAIVALMNQVNALYERDVAIRMILIGNNTDVIYTDAGADPFSNVGGNPCAANPRAENQANMDAVILTANYDIGHLVTGTNIGGCAAIGSVCSAADKARGVSGVTLGGAFDIGLTAHEMGHQFAANHTFNSISGTCGGQLTASSAYEPGSGTTIMSYAGSCAPDMIQGARDMFFHTHSYTQMDNFVTVGGGSGCVSNVATANAAPTVNAGASFTIPISTPFTLTGSGNDPDGDPLTFSWEQYDIGPQGSPNTPTGNAPLFRFFPPVNSSVRTFPQLSDLLNNTQTMGEILPSYTRSMDFRLVARDNVPNGGGSDFASTTVDVSATSGPFVVTSPNTSVVWCAGTNETVTWNVANTTDPPVSCANVNILLSIDGGQTFPIVVLANTPNDGSQMITVPNNPVVSDARIKVESVGNIFFDISNTDFTIYDPPAYTLQPVDVAAEWGDNVMFSVAFTGTPTPTVKWQLSTNGGGLFNDIPSETSSSLSLTCVTLAMDGYKYRAVITNPCGPVNSDVATLNVVPRVTTSSIVVTPNPQQYSDKVDFDIVILEAYVCGEYAATGADIYVGTQLMGSVLLSPNGTNLEASLDNIALLEPSPYGTLPTGQMAPGLRNVTAVLSGLNPNFDVSDPSVILVIEPEDARTYYTGACIASTSGVNSSAAIVTLSATIRDISVELADPDYDACPGDIRNATLSFIDRGTNTIIAANVPIGLVDPNDASTAVGTYDWNVNIVGDFETFEIGIIIGGYYTRNHPDDNTLVTVSKPLPNFVTGGGYLVLQSPAGIVGGNVGSKNNFGFNVKFNKKGTNLQGNVTTLIRKTEVDGLHIYKVKATKLQSLGIAPSLVGGKATINSKATIQDVTDPGNVIPIEGNGSLQIKFSDWGNPGNQDSIAITIWNKSGGLWYASNWTGTVTAEQVLAGGNLNISSNSSFSRYITNENLSELMIYPNPSTGQFNVSFDAPENSVYEIRLIDMLGRIVINKFYNAQLGHNDTFMDVSNLSTGVYSLILLNNEQVTTTKRVFINK